LRFVIGYDDVEMSAGDFVRVPPGTRHGFRNESDDRAELLVMFTPGGMEELFFRHRTDVKGFDEAAYALEAKQIHATVYEG
jgi:mannose-6-phosphate isomerase-like protein (cupin superfamily)